MPRVVTTRRSISQRRWSTHDAQGASSMRPIPVTIIAGFLGAGKTTLLERLLREARGVRYGVLVNDFASINIDAELIKEAGPERIALANGCVCCTIRDDLLAAALELARSAQHPDCILIECSGVSDPRAVAMALTGELAGAAFAIDAIVCLVDAANVMALDFHEIECVIDQAAAADLVLVNKCDLVASESIESIEGMLRDAQPAMRIIRTTNALVPVALISGEIERSESARVAQNFDHHFSHNGHDHASTFSSHAWEMRRALSLDDFTSAVRALPASVFRAKGLLHFSERPAQRAVFHLVGRRSELTFAPYAGDIGASVLVAIGRAGALDVTALVQFFATASLPRANEIPITNAVTGGTS